MFGTDLPAPTAGHLILYALGPGVGESIVVVGPGEEVIVIDACVHNGENLPSRLLKHLGRARIDLLVLTHPDLDHVRGIAQLVKDHDPKTVWRYPHGSAVRDVVASWARKQNAARFTDLADALEELEDHQLRTGRVFEAAYGERTWPAVPTAAFEVRPLAPTPVDQSRAWQAWERMLRVEKDGVRLLDGIQRVISGDAMLGDAPNVLSLALSIRCGSSRVLVGGDVMCGLKRGQRAPHSGWKGILKLLEQDGLTDLVRDPALVKVAHHGSRHSYEAKAWALHAASGKTVAMIAPFTSSSLPDSPTLAALRSHTRALLITTDHPDLRTRASAAGWVAGTTSVLTGTKAPCVVASFDSSAMTLSVSATAVHLG